ncbi:Uncharacterised protein [Mycobacteroides abscessus subsp. bolletii]|uniref:DUF7213 family protein n=1 Tax=Mycobacteroides abscessus TaxID=36809 RepID=UPI00092595CC|nr:hypothetical protein [Mycobacteroides abscessus]SHQ63075.1 Uncharacterised protein [Mycobacteroides abscessus subsp. bolletii]SHS46701.1 Uncharacterised protein [Mycobacteroides abscessus subsp. bolletii]SHT08173.1 Uncharacterised protein [Mycobacteroides abscessus subsp. bolletii]SHT13661.1 Uncharacterised protein [Mycobacteroides abscessus subsp. bolletii]SHY51227.1 Uncharacterised protein [Mycobacteroides abscessus subsp. bolletii]
MSEDLRKAAYRKIDEAVNELISIANDEADDGQPAIPTDYVVVVGSQWIDDVGDRVGGICIFPRGGSQPSYITTGLVATAQAFLTSDC